MWGRHGQSAARVRSWTLLCGAIKPDRTIYARRETRSQSRNRVASTIAAALARLGRAFMARDSWVSPSAADAEQPAPELNTHGNDRFEPVDRRKKGALNKKRLAALCREGAATARRINAEPWEPLPGMEKRLCPACRYWFAAAPATAEPRCPDCVRPTRSTAPKDGSVSATITSARAGR